jgi:hypothetical protein
MSGQPASPHLDREEPHRRGQDDPRPPCDHRDGPVDRRPTRRSNASRRRGAAPSEMGVEIRPKAGMRCVRRDEGGTTVRTGPYAARHGMAAIIDMPPPPCAPLAAIVDMPPPPCAPLPAIVDVSPPPSALLAAIVDAPTSPSVALRIVTLCRARVARAPPCVSRADVSVAGISWLSRVASCPVSSPTAGGPSASRSIQRGWSTNTRSSRTLATAYRMRWPRSDNGADIGVVKASRGCGRSRESGVAVVRLIPVRARRLASAPGRRPPSPSTEVVGVVMTFAVR